MKNEIFCIQFCLISSLMFMLGKKIVILCNMHGVSLEDKVILSSLLSKSKEKTGRFRNNEFIYPGNVG